MDLDAVMNALGDALTAIDDLNVYPFNTSSLVAPAAVVGLPEVVEYDQTMGRGSDRARVPLWLVVCNVDDLTAVTAINSYLSATGDNSIKAAVEADTTLGGAADTIRVVDATPETIVIGGVEYLAAMFTIDVWA